jgi:hypothetical protein
MDNSTFPIGELLNAGINGFVAYLIYNLIQQNRQLIAEVRERDGALLQLIHKLIERLD